MSLYLLKPTFVTRLHRVEEVARRRAWTPQAVTLAGLGFGLAAAGALWGGSVVAAVWLLVPVFGFLRLACNAIDGSLARATGQSTRRGAILNELGDRAADLAAAAALVPFVGTTFATALAVTLVTTSFTSVLAQAVIGERLSTGPMGKADRVAVLGVGAVGAVVAGPVALVVASWVLVLGCAGTVAARVWVLWRRAGADE